MWTFYINWSNFNVKFRKLTFFNEIAFKTCLIESVYNLKNYTKRPKDISDMKKLEPYLDKKKLAMLLQNPSRDVILKNVNFSEQINTHNR